MGIPKLFTYINSYFDSCVIPFNFSEKTTVDHLFIDSNCLLHVAAQHVFNYGQNKRIFYPYNFLSFSDKEKLVFDLYFKKILELTHRVVPKKSLFIAVDGVAPVAKQLQQRQRRFIAAKSSEDAEFDSNSITPGTLFMFRLKKYMHHAIKNALDLGLFGIQNLHVYFSSPNVPGEGEHKLLMYIRQNTKIHNDSMCIFGPDGDLIMLCLALSTNVQKLWLCREDFLDPFKYNLVNISKLKEQVLTKMNGNNIYDFIVLGFLLGNDFLPRIKMFYTLESGLNLLFKVYKYLGKELVTNKNLNIANMMDFFRILAMYEQKYIQKQLFLSVEEKFKDNTLYECTSNDVVDLKLLSTEYFGQKEMKEIVKEYMSCLEWNLIYYITELPDWHLSYAHHYAPFVSHIVSFFEYNNVQADILNSEFVCQNIVGTSPFLQLVMVLPPSSAHLLPKPFQRILIHPDSPLVKDGYYPTNFEIDMEGKTQDYQGVALLPFLEIKKAQTVYQKVENLVKKTYPRNKTDNLVLYSKGVKNILGLVSKN